MESFDNRFTSQVDFNPSYQMSTPYVQWMDFKLENVLVSLHSLKTMGLGPFGASAPLFLRNRELLGHSPIRN
jgi:hypothetical protein